MVDTDLAIINSVGSRQIFPGIYFNPVEFSLGIRYWIANTPDDIKRKQIEKILMTAVVIGTIGLFVTSLRRV